MPDGINGLMRDQEWIDRHANHTTWLWPWPRKTLTRDEVAALVAAFDVRIARCLVRVRLSLADLPNVSDDDLTSIRNLGDTALAKIRGRCPPNTQVIRTSWPVQPPRGDECAAQIGWCN